MVVSFLPPMLLARMGLREATGWHANVVLSHLIAFAGLCLTPLADWIDAIPHGCLSQSTLGLPCPGCGITRSATALKAGEFGRAFAANPAGPCLAAGFAVQFGLHSFALARGRSDSRATANRVSRYVGRSVVACLLLVWFFRLVQSAF